MTDATTPAPAKPVVSINLSGLSAFLDGNKTYLGCAIGAITVALNHFGLWPQSLIPLQIDPGQWVSDEWTIFLVATGRSAVKKLET